MIAPHLSARSARRSVGALLIVLSLSPVVVAGAAASKPGPVDTARASVTEIRVASGIGSGFVVSQGLVVTAAHVVADAETATVTFPDARAGGQCSVRSVQASRDLAILACDTGKHPPLRIEGQQVEVGTRVAAIGYPLGGNQRVTHGTITNTNPNAAGYIQTDAALDAGDSGGPLVAESDGGVVGVAAAIDTRDRSAGFVVPGPEIETLLAHLPPSATAPANRGGSGESAWPWALVGGILGFALGWILRTIVARSGSADSRHAESDVEVTVRDVAEPEIMLIGSPRPAATNDQPSPIAGSSMVNES